MVTGKLLTFDIINPLNRQPNKEGHLRRRLIHSDILKKRQWIIYTRQIYFPKRVTGDSFIQDLFHPSHTSNTQLLVSILYSDVSRLPLEQQYIIVCTGIWPERLKEMLSPKYIVAL